MRRFNPSGNYDGLSNRKMAALSILAIVVSVGAFVLLGTARLLVDTVSPPLLLDEELLVLTRPQDLPFFKAQIAGDQVFNSGLSEKTYSVVGLEPVSPGGSTRYFGFLAVGDHFLMIKTHDSLQSEGMKYTGVVTHVADDSNVLDIYNAYIQADSSLKQTLVPMVLDTNYDTSPWFAGFAFEIVLLIAGLAGLRHVWLSRRE